MQDFLNSSLVLFLSCTYCFLGCSTDNNLTTLISESCMVGKWLTLMFGQRNDIWLLLRLFLHPYTEQFLNICMKPKSNGFFWVLWFVLVGWVFLVDFHLLLILHQLQWVHLHIIFHNSKRTSEHNQKYMVALKASSLYLNPLQWREKQNELCSYKS